MKIQKIINIANLAAFDLNLPLLQYGFGSPKALIINNLHGDELTGFYVLEKLINALPENLNGQLSILTSANPLGLLQKQRLAPFEATDLNRGYPNPPKSRGVSSVIKDKIFELAMAHDIVIDLHTFMKPCLSALIALRQANNFNQAFLQKCLSIAGTDIILEMDLQMEEKRVVSALGLQLIKNGKFFVALEYPPSHCISEDKIARLADGLKKVLIVSGAIASSDLVLKQNCPPIFERQQMLNQHSGLFVPERILGEEIKSGEQFGQIIDVKTLDKTPLFSSYDGIIIEMADRGFYLFGEKLATIGKRRVI